MLKIIAAVAENGVIGRNEVVPWRLPADLQWFRTNTGSDPVVMGRKTFTSLPKRFRPLPGRENIVLTRDQWNSIEEGRITIYNSFKPVVTRSHSEDLWVIGGSEIYAQALPFTAELYLTRVHSTVEGDTFFPEWHPANWDLIFSKYHEADEKNEYSFTWMVYKRKSQPVSV